MRIRSFVFSLALVALSACGSSDETVVSEVTTTIAVAPSTSQAAAVSTTTTVATPVSARDLIPDPAATTVDDLLALGRPIVLAHASGEEESPHSSMYGYINAAIAGVDALDFDVRLTADGVLVVHHDDDTGRTADQDLVVHEATFDEVRTLDNAYWFTESCTCTDQPDDAYVWRGVRSGGMPAPEGFTADDFAIATFEEVLQTFPGWVLNIEIKRRAPEALAAADELARLLTEYDALDRSIVTSFDDIVVDYFHGIAPTVAMTPGLDMSTAFALGGVVPPEWARIMQVPPVYEGIEVFTPAYVEAAKAAGLVTWVWPNGGESYELYAELLALGADGINAARPREAIKALDDALAKS
jgi:glycerophosphoryl diester phosphodiesterase